MRLWFSAWCCLVALLVCLRAGADKASDAAAAQTLYDEARRLMKAGDYAAACPKLEASQKLDPGTGTQFHLADCYERIGRTASAWALFLEVAGGARERARAEQEQIARGRAGALEPKLSKLTIVVPEASRVDGLVIERDGTQVESALFGTPINVDPGRHSISAEAPGHRKVETEVTVGPDGAQKTVEIPPLEKAPVAEPPLLTQPRSDSAPKSQRSGKGMRVASYVALGVGAVGLGAGTFFALRSSSKRGEADDLHEACGGELQCRSSDGRTVRITELDDDARSAKKLATVSFVVGGVAAATGVTLFVLSRPSRKETPAAAAHVTPWIGLGKAGLSGRF
jgi:hypothetical protein